jgi:hypothetical protein
VSDDDARAGSTVTGNVNCVQLDAGSTVTGNDEQAHLITPEERLRVAMARQ